MSRRVVVTGVGLLIHIYATGYMAHEGGYYRFFAYLNLFMFFMLTLVLANNFVLLFVGWEGVGLCSYLLIGYYFEKKSAGDAAKKAFVVNRIGDFGFLLGLLTLFWTLGSEHGVWTLNFVEIAEHGHLLGTGSVVVTVITLCFFLGATGKSAQIPLYTWLPDAMEGPTPVSALIHAATMVTAGVYMIARSAALFELAPVTLAIVATVRGARQVAVPSEIRDLIAARLGDEALEIDSLVVLPLDNLMEDPGQAYFVEGMHEAIITELSRIPDLRVISRTSAMKYRDSALSVPEIATPPPPMPAVLL